MSLRPGDWFLASVATTAPLVSVLASLDAFLGSFPGFAGERWAIYAIVVSRLANTLAIAAAGIVPALVAHYGFVWNRKRVDEFTLEMNTVIAEVSFCLHRFNLSNR